MSVEQAARLLELPLPFTREQLRKAYLIALRVWHPDRFAQGDELQTLAKEKTRLIIEAQGILADALGHSDIYPPSTPRKTVPPKAHAASAPPPFSPGSADPRNQASQGTSKEPVRGSPQRPSPVVRRARSLGEWIFQIAAFVVGAIIVKSIVFYSVSVQPSPAVYRPPTPVPPLLQPASHQSQSSIPVQQGQANPQVLPKEEKFEEKPPISTVKITLVTSKGMIELELDEAKAPVSTANFVSYVKKGQYDNTIFHRVIPGFMIQGGGYAADMTQKATDAPIGNEASNGLKNDRGTIAMARTSNPNSATCQFFINVVDNRSLDAPNPDGFGYAVFGKVTKGMNVVDAIAAVPTGRVNGMADVPVDTITITSAINSTLKPNPHANTPPGSTSKVRAEVPSNAPVLLSDFDRLEARAKTGDDVAQFKLAYAYGNGNGVAKDEGEAIKWYRKAAAQGNVPAQNNLGFAYYRGSGLNKNWAEAVNWWVKAAEKGCANAQCSLGNAYGHGEGVAKDEATALIWYRKAAAQGFSNAQLSLGDAYANGEGVVKDPIEAIVWYRKSAKQGNATAQRSLAWCYATGRGVTPNIISAHMLYRLALTRGDSEALNPLQALEIQMSPTQIAEAEQLARNFRPE